MLPRDTFVEMAALHLLSRQDEGSSFETELPILTKNPGPTVNAAIWSVGAVSTLFLFLRVYCKQVRAKGMWWDDYLLIISWMFLIAANGLVTELMRLGFGLTLEFQPHMHTLSTTADVTNKVGLALSKTSFAVTLLRLSQGWQKWFIWFLIVTMNGVLATNAVTTWKPACDRVGDDYESVLPGGCWRVEDAVIMAMVANGYSALCDFSLALLPWKIVWNLQMKRLEKIGVGVAMSLGMIAGILGVIKVVQAVTITAGPDIPYRLSMLFIWGQAEPFVTVIASSIPPLRVLFRDMHRSKYAVNHSSGTGGYLRSNDQNKFPLTTITTERIRRRDSQDDDSDISILPPERVKVHGVKVDKER